MQKTLLSLKEIASSITSHRLLILNLIKREVLSRYKGSFLGVFWSFVTPIFMLVVYTFVFSSVFKMSWTNLNSSKTEFALILFAGLIVFNFFAECCNKASMLIINNTNYVKKVVFPLEILSWVNVGSVLFHAIISLFVWIVGYTIFNGIPHITILFLPFIFLPLIFISIGLSWILSSLGVFFRDIAPIMALITNVLMFLTPIFYSVKAIPEKYQPILLLNPLVPIINWTRDVLYWGELPNMLYYFIFLIFSFIFAWIGFIFFQKTRKGFADVI